MGFRSYLPTLKAIVQRLCLYITRYGDQIRKNLAGDALIAFEALELACHAFNAQLEIPPGD